MKRTKTKTEVDALAGLSASEIAELLASQGPVVKVVKNEETGEYDMVASKMYRVDEEDMPNTLQIPDVRGMGYSPKPIAPIPAVVASKAVHGTIEPAWQSEIDELRAAVQDLNERIKVLEKGKWKGFHVRPKI